MAKFFETNEEYVDLVVNKFNETGLNSMGFVIKVMSVNKAKNIVKVSKANATAEFLMKKDGLITLIIPIMPNSSDIIENIKSVCGSGK